MLETGVWKMKRIQKLKICVLFSILILNLPAAAAHFLESPGSENSKETEEATKKNGDDSTPNRTLTSVSEIAEKLKHDALSVFQGFDRPVIDSQLNLSLKKKRFHAAGEHANENRVVQSDSSKEKKNYWFGLKNSPIFWGRMKFSFPRPDEEGDVAPVAPVGRTDNNESDNEEVEVITTTPMGGKGTVINRPLDPLYYPFYNFTIDWKKTTYIFELRADVRNKYLISVVVEKMNCTKKGDVGEGDLPRLYVKGESTGIDIMCDIFDFSQDDFQSVLQDHYKGGDKHVTIEGHGDWTGVTAQVVASVYYEATHCSNCSMGHFCCGNHYSACTQSQSLRSSSSSKHTKPAKSSSSNLIGSQQDQYRCIPGKDFNGRSLLCNEHPNCGLPCNLDELEDHCGKEGGGSGSDPGGDDASCSGFYTCRDESQPDRFFIAILLLVVFCVFVPFCIFIFFCSRKELRREFSSGRRPGCPWPLEVLLCPFSINADSNVPPENVRPRTNANNRRGNRANERRGIRRTEEVRPRPIRIGPLQHGQGMDNFSYFNDLPPPYSECCDNKELYPSPPKYQLPLTSTPADNSQGQSQLSSRPRSHSLPQQTAEIEYIVLPELERSRISRSPGQSSNVQNVPVHYCSCSGTRTNVTGQSENGSSQSHA